jgi:pimeloyl-ACP methyl ester carboxylesterase
MFKNFSSSGLAHCLFTLTLLSLCPLISADTAVFAKRQDECALKRRAFMGARLAAVPDSLQQKYGLQSQQGVLITGVVPNSSAASSGLTTGDIILRLQEKPVGSYQEVIDLLSNYRAEDNLQIHLMRNGQTLVSKLALKSLPQESYDGITVRYDQVASGEACLRTIITKPANASGRLPAIFILQGYDCGSIDQPFSPEGTYARLVRHFSELGYATFRVEKNGVGDSRGEPCAEIGFHPETQGFRDGLQRLKQYEFVDPDQIYLLGLSMGGVWAPILAAQEKVRGVMVYGTIGKPWAEYILENWRRQWRLDGRDPVRIERDLRHEYDMMYQLLAENLSPMQIIARHPHLRDRIYELTTDADTTDIRHFFGRHYRFIQELDEINLTQQWQKVEAKVLVMWGRGDYVSSRGDHQLILEIVNHYHPGNASYVEIDADHWFEKAATFEESHARRRANTPGEFNPAALAEMQAWLATVKK